ncbi:MAG: T9SS type A sorting domain-containing protein, partial [Bacteroidota bacterium]
LDFLSSGVMTFEINGIALQLCNTSENIADDCFPEEFDFNIQYNGGGNYAGNNDGGTTNDCLVTITAEQLTPPDYAQTMLWSGPDGFSAVGLVLEDVPLGVYTATYFNECGDSETYTVDTCPGGYSTSDWMFDEETDQFCRTITCVGGGECEGNSSQECFTPAFGAWEYDDFSGTACREIICPDGELCDQDLQCVKVTYGDWDYRVEGLYTICFRDVFARGERIAEEENAAMITYEYDEFLERCYRYIKCGTDLDLNPETVETQSEEPNFGDWEYDDFLTVCVREVRCFTLTDDDIALDPNVDFEDPTNTEWPSENDNPAYNWDYSDFGGCIGYVFCDEFESTQILSNSDWTLNNGEGTPEFTSVDYDVVLTTVRCVIDISCNYNFESFSTIHPPLLSDPIQAHAAEYIHAGPVGTMGDFCRYYYQCGDLPPRDLEQNIVGEQLPDGQCRVWCDGFQTTTQQIVACTQINDLAAEGTIIRELKNSEDFNLAFSTTNDSEETPNSSVGPNPFDQEIMLRNLPVSDNINIYLTNTNGQVVLEEQVQGLSSYKVLTAELPQGVYFLQISSNDRMIYQTKLIKVNP